MPKGKYNENRYLPTTGVRTDFKRFMNTFLASNTVRYEHFSEVWRERNMSYLCAGRNSDREAREFMERVMLIAEEYFLPPFQFQVRVGGLYLLYALYQTQPLVPKVKIRMTPSHWQDTLFFQQQASQQNHLDVVYVFQRLLQEQAFLFCFTPTEMSSYASIKETQDKEENLADSLKEERTAITSLFNYESLEQLSYLQDQYQQMKIGLAGPKAAKPDKSLDVVQGELVEDLLVLMQTFRTEVATISKQGQKAEEKPGEEEVQEESTGNRRQLLKAQAYSSVKAPSKKTHNVVVESSKPVESSQPMEAQGSTTRLIKEASVVRLDTRGSQKAPLSMPVLVHEDDNSSSDDDDEDYVPPGKKSNKLDSTRKSGAAAKVLPQAGRKHIPAVQNRKVGRPRSKESNQDILVTSPCRKSQQAPVRAPGSKYEVIFAPVGRTALLKTPSKKEITSAPHGTKPGNHNNVERDTDSEFEMTDTPPDQPVKSDIGKGNFSEAVMNMTSKARKGKNKTLETDVNDRDVASRKRRNSSFKETHGTVTEIRVVKEIGKPASVQSCQKTQAKVKMEEVTGGSVNKSASSFAAFLSTQGALSNTGHPAVSESIHEINPSKRFKQTSSAGSVQNGDKTKCVTMSRSTEASRLSEGFAGRTVQADMYSKNSGKPAEVTRYAHPKSARGASVGNCTRPSDDVTVIEIDDTDDIRSVGAQKFVHRKLKSTTINAIAKRAGGGTSKNDPPRPVQFIKVVKKSPTDALSRLKERCMKSREAKEEPVDEYINRIIKTGKQESGFEPNMSFEDTSMEFSDFLLDQDDIGSEEIHNSDTALYYYDEKDSIFPLHSIRKRPKKKDSTVEGFKFI